MQMGKEGWSKILEAKEDWKEKQIEMIVIMKFKKIIQKEKNMKNSINTSFPIHRPSFLV